MDRVVNQILNALRHADRYGFQIIRAIGTDAFPQGEGHLYPMLCRMEDVGDIQGEWRMDERRRWRRFYTLTRQGRRTLDKVAGVVIR